MPVQEPENDETLNTFKYAAERHFGLPDDVAKGRLVACQVYHALLAATNSPREELSDLTLVYAIAAGMSDALSRVTSQEDLEDLTEELIDAIRDDNGYKIYNGFCSETFLPKLSVADEKSLSDTIAGWLEKRIQFEKWRSRIFNTDERLSSAEFDRRAQSDPRPVGPLDPHWQIKRDCKEIIRHLQADDPIVAAAEKLLEVIENKGCHEISKTKSCDTHEG